MLKIHGATSDEYCICGGNFEGLILSCTGVVDYVYFVVFRLRMVNGKIVAFEENFPWVFGRSKYVARNIFFVSI